MRLFIYIFFCFSLFIISSEKESLEDEKVEKFLTAAELDSLRAMVPENLRYEIPEIPNNSFVDLQNFLKDKEAPRFSDQHRVTIKKIEDFKKVSSKELRSLKGSIDEQEAHFTKMQDLMKDRPYVFIPNETQLFLVLDMSHFRSAIQYFNVKNLISYRKKEYDNAVKYLEKAVNVTQKLENRKGSLLDQFSVMACKGIIYDRILWILKHKNNSFKNISELERILKRMEQSKDVWDDTVKYEIFFSLKMFKLMPLDIDLLEGLAGILETFDKELDKLSNDVLPKKGVNKKDFKNDVTELKNIYTFIFNEQLQTLSAFLADIKVQPLKEHKNFKRNLEKQKKIENQLVRRIAISSLYSSILLRIVAGKENHRQALLLISAIRKYELKDKRAPKSFKDMIAGAVLSEIPKDMWTGKNLKVDIKKRYVEFDSTNKTETKKCYF